MRKSTKDIAIALLVGFLLFLGVAMLPVSPAVAQDTPSSTRVGPWMCSCPGGQVPLGDASNCTEACFGKHGYSTYVPPPVDPHVLLRRRFQLILSHYGTYFDKSQISGDNLNDDAQFIEAVTQAYRELYHNIAWWRVHTPFLKTEKREAEGQFDWYASRLESFDVNDGYDSKLRNQYQQDLNKLAAVKAETARVQDALDSIDNGGLKRAANFLNRNAALTQKELAVLFPRTKDSLPINQVGKDEAEYYHIYLLGPPAAQCQGDTICDGSMEYSAAISQYPSAPPAGPAFPEPITPPTPVLNGSAESRMQQLEALAPTAPAAWNSYSQAKGDYDDMAGRLNADERLWNKERPKNMKLEATDYKLFHDTIPRARVGLLLARQSLALKLYHFFGDGAAGATWSFFRKYYMEPEAKRIATAGYKGGGIPLGDLSDAEIEAAWKQQRFNLFAAYHAKDDFGMVQVLVSKARKLANTSGSDATLAAEVLAHGSPQDIQNVGDELFQGMDSDAREESRSALAQLDLPNAFKNFWQAYFLGSRSHDHE